MSSLLASFSFTLAERTERINGVFEMASALAAKAGVRRDSCKMQFLDMDVMVIVGLETARKARLKRDSTLGEAFEQGLCLLLAALLAMGIFLKCCGNERERIDYEQAVQRVLRRRCASAAATVAATGATGGSRRRAGKTRSS